MSPRLGQEQVTELGLPGLGADVPPALDVAWVQRDHADHRSGAFDHETAGTSARHFGHRTLQFVAGPGAADVGAHLGRGEQLDERRAVPGLGRAEHEPFGR
ncbi:hypothetical protein ADK53_32935 [Streptomyces sp. WM6373]|nr:hypothetical protein ADK53_32935 [Streptomyces sp. WM6373]